jgi:pre-mRNA-processing factor 19
LILETYQLKQQLAETRQELSTSLYYNDSAQRVIARLQKERDEARDALSRVSVTATSNGASNADAMQVDGQPLSEEALAKVTDTQERLSKTRRKRPVPEDWATADDVQTYGVTATVDTQFTGAKTLASDESGELFLCGDSDGTIGVFDKQAGAFTTRSNLGAGAILGGAWCSDKQVVSTSSGTVVVAQEGAVQGKFQQHAGAATAVASHPSGELVVSVGYDKSYILYDISAMRVLTQVYGDIGEEPIPS